MSESSNTVENEPLDPRIQIELERANAATSEINNLETQLEDARKLFQLSFSQCKQRLANLAKTLGRCVDRARPFYDVSRQAREAQIETQRAAQEYQSSVESLCDAQENLTIAETKLSLMDPSTKQEYIDHITQKVIQAEQDKVRCERIHAEKSKLYQDYEQQRISLSRSLTRTIIKAKPYFDAKVKAEDALKNQKLRIEDVQKALVQAKATYRTALSNLEQISEEIHSKRQNQTVVKLPPREPGVGAEKSDEFMEFPSLEPAEFVKIDLSDDSSDSDTPHGASTTCMHTSSNIELCKTNSPTVTNTCANHLGAPTTDACQTDKSRARRQKAGKTKPTRMILTTETPLLSHLVGAQKSHSDPSLNLMTRR